jgi:hypothetical protein
MTATPGIPRPSAAVASGTSGAPQQRPAANGGLPEAQKQDGEFPRRITVNITTAMSASLERMRRRLRLKEAVVARLGLMHYLAANDPQYREDD